MGIGKAPSIGEADTDVTPVKKNILMILFFPIKIDFLYLVKGLFLNYYFKL